MPQQHRLPWRVTATAAVLTALLLGIVAPVWAQGSVWVNPYTRSDGSYVQGHYRSAPDGNRSNNWSSYPNVNPYTGRQGTRDPYSSGSGSDSSYGQSLYGSSGSSSRPRCTSSYFGC
jgi:hypothetical protein